MKRKAPASRANPVTPIKREKIVDGQDSGEELSDLNPVYDELEEIATYLPVCKSSVTGKMILDEGTQTVFTKYNMLSAKVETMILKNEVSTMKEQKSKMSSLSRIKSAVISTFYTVSHTSQKLLAFSALF